MSHDVMYIQTLGYVYYTQDTYMLKPCMCACTQALKMTLKDVSGIVYSNVYYYRL